jgi:hypothetical protein
MSLTLFSYFLQIKGSLNGFGSLWDIDYTFDEALKLLEGFNFNVLLNPIETPKEFLPERLITQFKVRIKNKGIIWLSIDMIQIHFHLILMHTK